MVKQQQQQQQQNPTKIPEGLSGFQKGVHALFSSLDCGQGGRSDELWTHSAGSGGGLPISLAGPEVLSRMVSEDSSVRSNQCGNFLSDRRLRAERKAESRGRKATSF